MSKNALIHTLVYSFFPFLLFCQINDEGQSNNISPWSFHLKMGMPFFENNQEPTYSSFNTSFKFRPNVNAILGMGYQFLKEKKVNFSTGLSYDFGGFSRIEEYNYTRWDGESRSGIITDRYRTHSLILPLKIHYNLKHSNFFIGVARTLHVSTKANIEQEFYEQGKFSSKVERTYKDGDVWGERGGLQDEITVELDHKINFQFVAGFQIRLNPRFLLDFEYRQYLRENLLEKDHWHYDAGSAYDYFDPFARTLSIGIEYRVTNNQ